jgi:hypothetical protein
MLRCLVNLRRKRSPSIMPLPAPDSSASVGLLVNHDDRTLPYFGRSSIDEQQTIAAQYSQHGYFVDNSGHYFDNASYIYSVRLVWIIRGRPIDVHTILFYFSRILHGRTLLALSSKPQLWRTSRLTIKQPASHPSIPNWTTHITLTPLALHLLRMVRVIQTASPLPHRGRRNCMLNMLHQLSWRTSTTFSILCSISTLATQPSLLRALSSRAFTFVAISIYICILLIYFSSLSRCVSCLRHGHFIQGMSRSLLHPVH